MTFCLSNLVNFHQGYLISFFYHIHYTIVLQIDRNFKNEIFLILPTRFFDHTNVTFKFFSKGVSVSFSTVLSPFTHLRYFQALGLFKVFFLTILCIDDRLIPVCSAIFLGAKFAWYYSSCEQTNSSIKSMCTSVETALGFPEPCLLSIKLVSANFFNRRLTEEY